MHRQPIRVLLIDDDVTFIKAVSDIIAETTDIYPPSLSTVSTLEAGLNRLAEESVDVAFLSLDLPGIDRCEAIRKIHQSNALLPVIFITGGAHENDARQAIKEDALDYLCKDELNPRFLGHIIRYMQESRRAQEKLKRTSREWRATFDSIPDWIMILDEECRITKVNKAFADSFSMHPKQLIGKKCRELLGGVDWSCDDCLHDEVIRHKQPRVTELFNLRLSIHQEITAAPLINHQGRVIGTSYVAKDITEKKQAEIDREMLIAGLSSALAKVKTLSGLLPICASCKRIRDDRGKWSPIEAYIHDRSNAQFSHGICPECAKKLYPKYYDNEED